MFLRDCIVRIWSSCCIQTEKNRGILGSLKQEKTVVKDREGIGSLSSLEPCVSHCQSPLCHRLTGMRSQGPDFSRSLWFWLQNQTIIEGKKNCNRTQVAGICCTETEKPKNSQPGFSLSKVSSKFGLVRPDLLAEVQPIQAV